MLNFNNIGSGSLVIHKDRSIPGKPDLDGYIEFPSGDSVHKFEVSAWIKLGPGGTPCYGLVFKDAEWFRGNLFRTENQTLSVAPDYLGNFGPDQEFGVIGRKIQGQDGNITHIELQVYDRKDLNRLMLAHS